MSISLKVELSNQDPRYTKYLQPLACLNSLKIPENEALIESVEPTHGDTYQWIFQDTVGFEDWLRGRIQRPFYWIRGKPASGKSTAMKMALQHSRTRLLLHEYSDEPWIFAGFFFHNRGNDRQKSVTGLLQEILHQILCERKSFIRGLLHHYPKRFNFSGPSLQIEWTLSDVKAALELLVTKNSFNLCLFIDALDKHAGNYHDLLSILKVFENHDEVGNFRLRACLASRLANIFQQHLRQCLGFSIQDHTVPDIKGIHVGCRVRGYIWAFFYPLSP